MPDVKKTFFYELNLFGAIFYLILLLLMVPPAIEFSEGVDSAA